METNAWPRIELEEHRLASGLRVIVAEDHIAPVVAVNIWYDVGSRDERAGRAGFAHLFEHMMFQGSANVAKGEHFRLIQRAGGALNASTNLHRTNYFESGPSNQLDLYLWLEADRMGGLLAALGQETLDNQRDVVKNEKRQNYDNPPYGGWWPRMLERLFPEGHPYHHATIGKMEDLDAATVGDVHGFFSSHYAPNNAVLSIVGDVAPAEALAAAERHFGPIPANSAVPETPSCEAPLGLGGPQREVVPDRVPLPRVFASFRAPAAGTPQADALFVASAALAFGFGNGGKAARLHRRLVRERRLAQDVVFIVQGFPGCSVATGWATARAGVALPELEQAFEATVASVADEGIGDEELARVRANIERRVIEDNMQRASSRADWLSQHATMYGDPGRVNERLPSLLGVTAAEAREAARAVFRADNRVTLVYVPKEAA